MSVNVSAVVLHHDQPQLLSVVIEKLGQQTFPPNRILIVDTSKKSPANIPGFEVLRLPASTSLQDAFDAAVKRISQEGYLWLLHDDSAPEQDALEKLLHQAELSPSLAIVGPKQVDWDDRKIIRQLGLTLTRSGRVLSRVRGEFDQGQHDRMQDVLAVGTAGALIKTSSYKELEGFDSAAPAFAADIDFSIRARLSGSRVAVAPEARVAHKMLSLDGKRPFSYLGSTPKVAMRQAELYLLLAYANPLVFLGLWLMLLPLALLNSLVLLVTKRARLIAGELLSAAIVFGSLFKLLSSRGKIKRTTKLPLRSLVDLRATREEVGSAKRRDLDAEISKQLLAAHARGETLDPSQKVAGIVSGGALWWVFVLIAIQIAWFPIGSAISAAGVLPVSASWLDIFFQAGAQYQNLGLGAAVASDPFVWVLAIITSFTFFEPNLAITWLSFLASPLAFLGAFKLLGLFATNTTVRVVAALSYALSPFLTSALAEVRFSQLVATMALPWLIFNLAKIAQLQVVAAPGVSKSWAEVALAAILFAFVVAASPVMALALTAVLIVFMAITPARALKLLFVPLLTILWYLPIALERLNSASWLTLLLDPGPRVASSQTGNWTLIFQGFGFESFDLTQLVAVALLITAIVATIFVQATRAVAIWLVALISLGISFVALGVEFEVAPDSAFKPAVNALLGLFVLALIALIAQAAQSSTRFGLVASSVLLVAVLPAGFALATNPPKTTYSDGQIVPSLVLAEARSGADFRTLRLSELEDGSVAVELLPTDGIQLDELSTGYLLASSESIKSDPAYQELGQLAANLVSANGAEIISTLDKLRIHYLLVQPESKDLQMALDSTSKLESVGETNFGQLWKVENEAEVSVSRPRDYLMIQAAQLALLLIYLVLAIPTGYRTSRGGKQNEIFVDAEENN